VLDQRLLTPTVVLLGGGDQGGVDDLTAACDETLPEQLRRDTVKERLGARFTDPVLEGPVVRSGTWVAFASPQKRL
jgi:hypothetical protein